MFEFREVKRRALNKIRTLIPHKTFKSFGQAISAAGSNNDTVQYDIQEIDGILILLQSLMDSIRDNVEQDCLENAISLLKASLDNGITSEEVRLTVYRQLIRALLVRYSVYGWIENIDDSLTHSCLGVGAEGRERFLLICQGSIDNVPEVEVATQLINVFQRSIHMATLDSIITTATEALASYNMTYLGDKPSHQAARLWIVLGKALVMKYLTNGDIAVLHQATRRFQQAELNCLKDTTLLLISSTGLLQIEYLQVIESGDVQAFGRTADYLRKAVDADMEGAKLYEVGAGMVDHAVDDAQLQEGIAFLAASLNCRMEGHPRRCDSLSRLACGLSTSFERKGDLGELKRSVALEREALVLRPHTHPDRFLSLGRLSSSLWSRFEHKGAIEDLEECIALKREALDLCHSPDPNRSKSLHNLATSLLTRFQHNGAFEDLEECIALHREALNLSQPPHPTLLDNLANSLLIRFKHKGAFEDLEECIVLYREALNLLQPPNHKRCHPLNNLASSLFTRFEHKKVFGDLEECIALSQEALDLLQPPNPNRSTALSSLAISLSSRYNHKGVFEDLEECIALKREVLDLCQAPHAIFHSLHNLAISYLDRFKHKGAFEDLEECIALHQKALELCQPPHPDRPVSLSSLASSLVTRFEQTGSLPDIEKALEYYQSAAKYPTGSPIDRLKASKRWATCAQNHDPVSTLDAYKYSMELLPQLVSFDLTLQARRDVLHHIHDPVGNAARSAINAGQYELAVTFLSIGRSIFWSQALHLRKPVDDLMATNSDIAQRFIYVSRQLENASYSQDASILSSSSSLAGGPYPGAGTYKRLHLLANERQQIIEKIRTIPGYETFLRPPSFSTLQPAAKNGSIILLSMSHSGCDALIVRWEGSVKHIPLPEIDLEGLKVLHHLIDTSLALGMRTVEISRDVRDGLWKVLGRDMVLETSSTTVTREEALRLALGYLWILVVKPVVDALGIEKTSSPKRLWWCPTGPFSSLPLHAAGLYSDDDRPDDCLFHYAISSYCTYPQDLLHPPPPMSQSFKMTAVIEPEAPKAGRLPATLTELDRIKQHVPDQQHLIAHVGSINTPNRVEDVVMNIKNSSFVHFGCHGKQSIENPLESLLLLSGGNLTMETLIKDCQVPEGALAYLSACETAKGDEERPDESLNLVATMMFAGFRSVVGTLWSILDYDAPIVADVFYQHLFRKGKDALPDVRDAAYGLHLATQELRDRGRPLYSWVPFVHYGI